MNDHIGAGLRWETAPIRWYPESKDEYSALKEMLEGMGRGEALFIDEAARLVPRGANSKNNLLFQFLDVARNNGIKFALAEKRATRLEPLLSDLADAIVFRPSRSPSSKAWLRAAGAEDNYTSLPFITDQNGKPTQENPWYMLPVGGDNVEIITQGDVAELFAKVDGKEYKSQTVNTEADLWTNFLQSLAESSSLAS